MRVLFAGEGSPEGSAGYTLGLLKALKARVAHVPSTSHLRGRVLRSRFDVVILGDFPRARAPRASQRIISAWVTEGAGLLMVGGWGSFSAPFGRWEGSIVEGLLPIQCLGRDDRRNFPSGALMVLKHRHPMWSGMSFADPPVICGLNEVRPGPKSQVLFSVRRIVSRGRTGAPPQLELAPVECPLLVIGTDSQRRVAAMATDTAPHWCGRLVDWGRRRRVIRVTGWVTLEVGDCYIEFLSRLIQWLAGRLPSACSASRS